VNNRVRIKLAGRLAPDATPTDCREVAVLGETERDRLNRLGKENIVAARRTERRLAGIKINPDQQISPVHGVAGSGAARVGFVRCSVLPQLLFLAATADPRPAR
jgi:hypothetical protein